MKKRSGRHERTLREFRLDQGRITVGGILHEFRGVLTGVPMYEAAETPAGGKEGL
jgi:circadian clock protein KaiC